MLLVPNDRAGFREPSLRNCPERGLGAAPSVDLGGVRWPKWGEKSLLVAPQSYSVVASGAFRTVSQMDFSETLPPAAARGAPINRLLRHLFKSLLTFKLLFTIDNFVVLCHSPSALRT